MWALKSIKDARVQEWLITLTLLALGLGAAVWWAQRVVDGRETVVSSVDVGAAVTATYIDSTLDANKTRVETDSGVFLVYGSMALRKGERFTLEERKNGNRMLCKAGTRECRKLAN